MKKKQLFTHMEVLNQSYPFWDDNRFRQAILENIEYTRPEVEKLEKMQKEDRECLKAFDEKHNPLILKYGKEIPERKGMFSAPIEGDENFEKYIKEYEPLKEEYAKEIEKWEVKNKKFRDEILEEEIKLKIYPVSVIYAPKELPDPYFPYLVANKIIQNTPII